MPTKENEGEFESIINIKYFDVELKLIEEWVQNTKYDVDYTNTLTNKSTIET